MALYGDMHICSHIIHLNKSIPKLRKSISDCPQPVLSIDLDLKHLGQVNPIAKPSTNSYIYFKFSVSNPPVNRSNGANSGYISSQFAFGNSLKHLSHCLTPYM
jgi:hypothetical protein